LTSLVITWCSIWVMLWHFLLTVLILTVPKPHRNLNFSSWRRKENCTCYLFWLWNYVAITGQFSSLLLIGAAIQLQFNAINLLELAHNQKSTTVTSPITTVLVNKKARDEEASLSHLPLALYCMASCFYIRQVDTIKAW